MSWFDGYIPEECRDCFYQEGGVWKERENIECDDSCEFYLNMIPVITEDGKLDREKMELLECSTGNPVWHTSKRTF